MFGATRTIVSAMYPIRVDDDCRVFLKVWFAELSGPIEFLASPLDCESHGKELWIRAMAGEYGPVQILERRLLEAPRRELKLLEAPRS